MPIKHALSFSLGAATLLLAAAIARAAPLMIVGNDEKVLWDEGDTILSAPGKDSVVILDLANPEAPKIVANLPLKNSVVGPPVNVAIDPTNSIALVANSVDVVKDGDKLKTGAGRQGLRHRSQGHAAQARRHRDGRQAAVGAQLQSRRQPSRWSPIAPTSRSACCRSRAPTSS